MLSEIPKKLSQKVNKLNFAGSGPVKRYFRNSLRESDSASRHILILEARKSLVDANYRNAAFGLILPFVTAFLVIDFDHRFESKKIILENISIPYKTELISGYEHMKLVLFPCISLMYILVSIAQLHQRKILEKYDMNTLSKGYDKISRWIEPALNEDKTINQNKLVDLVLNLFQDDINSENSVKLNELIYFFDNDHRNELRICFYELGEYIQNIDGDKQRLIQAFQDRNFYSTFRKMVIANSAKRASPATPEEINAMRFWNIAEKSAIIAVALGFAW
ncbi:MAG: hypothetical protein OHK0017_11370 [Patescibacteria group bacterium]